MSDLPWGGIVRSSIFSLGSSAVASQLHVFGRELASALQASNRHEVVKSVSALLSPNSRPASRIRHSKAREFPRSTPIGWSAEHKYYRVGFCVSRTTAHERALIPRTAKASEKCRAIRFLTHRLRLPTSTIPAFGRTCNMTKLELAWKSDVADPVAVSTAINRVTSAYLY